MSILLFFLFSIYLFLQGGKSDAESSGDDSADSDEEDNEKEEKVEKSKDKKVKKEKVKLERIKDEDDSSSKKRKAPAVSSKTKVNTIIFLLFSCLLFE